MIRMILLLIIIIMMMISVVVISIHKISNRGAPIPEPLLIFTSECPLEVQISQGPDPLFHIELLKTGRTLCVTGACGMLPTMGACGMCECADVRMCGCADVASDKLTAARAGASSLSGGPGTGTMAPFAAFAPSAGGARTTGERSRIEQSRAEQSRAEQSRAEQSRAEQSSVEQSRVEQRRNLVFGFSFDCARAPR